MPGGSARDPYDPSAPVTEGLATTSSAAHIARRRLSSLIHPPEQNTPGTGFTSPGTAEALRAPGVAATERRLQMTTAPLPLWWVVPLSTRCVNTVAMGVKPTGKS